MGGAIAVGASNTVSIATEPLKSKSIATVGMYGTSVPPAPLESLRLIMVYANTKEAFAGMTNGVVDCASLASMAITPVAAGTVNVSVKVVPASCV